MSKIVVLVEKPSMKKKYESALAGVPNITITNSVGHIEALVPPEFYVGQKEISWNELEKNLPIIPNKFQVQVTKGDVFQNIANAMQGATEIVLACDPDREGELIHRNILEILQYKKVIGNDIKITRCWVLGETQKGILDAFNKRSDYLDYDGWYKSARLRSYIDWIIGIQLTVLYSVKYSVPGQPLSVGRIQSWLLSEICKRYEEFKNFVSQPFWTISFLTNNDNIKFNLIKDDKIYQIFDEKEFSKIYNEVKGKPLVINKIETKPFVENAPKLYHASALQMDASKLYGLDPDETLEIMQALYERHTLISYPRSACNVLSEEEAKEISHSVDLVGMFDKYKYLKEAVLKENPTITLSNKYIGKLDGHYAIIPVFTYDKNYVPELNDKESKVFDLVVKRFINTLLPPIKGDKTFITGSIGPHTFYVEIKNIIDKGYKKYYENDSVEDLDSEDKNENEIVKQLDLTKYYQGNLIGGDTNFVKGDTKPKPLFKAKDIISLMENAHLYIKDPALRESLKEAKGIGTESTRPSFMPILLKREYVEKVKGAWIPTKKGLSLNNLLPEELKVSDFSAKLEMDLFNILKKKGRTEDILLEEIKTLMNKVINNVRSSDFKIEKQCLNIPCPLCSGRLEYKKIGNSDAYTKCEKCGATGSLSGIKIDKSGSELLINPNDISILVNKIKNSKAIVYETDYPCPKCGGGIVLKKHEKGWFTYCKNSVGQGKCKQDLLWLPKDVVLNPIENEVAKIAHIMVNVKGKDELRDNEHDIEVPCPACKGKLTLKKPKDNWVVSCHNYECNKKTGKAYWLPKDFTPDLDFLGQVSDMIIQKINEETAFKDDLKSKGIKIPKCPSCKKPMALREKDGKKYWSCQFFKRGCEKGGFKKYEENTGVE